jgi:hypothetical protein
MFELGKKNWYIVQNVEPNEFLNSKLESDQYGIYYSVKFEGDAETYLLQAKSAPVNEEKLFGHIEQSKSGKSLRFKKDKLEDAPTAQEGSTQSPNESIARAVALKAAVEFANNAIDEMAILNIADTFLAWLTNSGSQSEGIIPQATNDSKSQSAAAIERTKEAVRKWDNIGKVKQDEEPDEQWSEPLPTFEGE